MTLNNWVLCGYILNKWEEKLAKMEKKVLYIWIYYGFSLLHIFSLVLQPWMSAYIRKTDGVYISVPKND
jgi:hypothetical protein